MAPNDRREDPATTHARLAAAALAAHANACAAADAFLRDGTTPGGNNTPGDLVLSQTTRKRSARIDAGTPDEREFSVSEALQAYVRRCLVKSQTVRRLGWTAADPEDARIQPDSARLLLHTGNPLVDITAAIRMDGSLDAPTLRYGSDESAMQRFDHNAHNLEETGIRYIASLFRI